MPNDFAAVVLGGGPAGAICALRLADRGVPTLLVDKATFPRPKVCGCCLNLAAADLLSEVGLSDLPSRLGARPLTRWQGRWNGTSVDCPLPGGWALSRTRLDEALIEQAAAAGATVRTGTTGAVQSLQDSSVTIELRPTERDGSNSHGQPAPSERVTASVAIVATGLSGGGLERWLPYQKRPAGPFGVGLNVDCEPDSYSAGTIFMACGSSGYVGAVRLEDGTLDVAAALMPVAANRRSGISEPRPERCADALRQTSQAGSARESLSHRMRRIVEEAGFPSTCRWHYDPNAVRTTPRLRRLRRVGRGRLIAIGDAAGYVEPFTGEGMAWAMRSGLMAADLVAETLPCDADSLGRRWISTRRRLLHRREWPCRLLAATLQSDVGRRGLFTSLHRMPWLAAPVVRYMNRA